MRFVVRDDAAEVSRLAARDGAVLIRQAIQQRGEATIVLATGASQLLMLDALIEEPGVAWNKVNAFHLDEYVGIPITHPASFRLYLWQRFVSRLPLPLKSFHYLDGEGDCEASCRRAGEAIRLSPVDVAFVGIGENGHLAFNDPPANFDTDEPFLIVTLDEACRRQQLGEGWFKTLDEVPKRAISMSISQIMKSAAIICTVLDERKAKAVADTIDGKVTPDVPASILQKHGQTAFYLDHLAASQLKARANAR